MKKSKYISLGIIILLFILGAYFYPHMPDKVASHWGINGQVNGYMSKLQALFLLPCMALGMFLFFLVIPHIDPLKTNFKKFSKYYDKFIVMILLFLLYIYSLTIFWNLGQRFNMIQFLAPSLGILFFYIGVIFEKVERNWFIGIRTPWTISNDKVWKQTHILGAKLFKICGLVALLGILIPNLAMFLILLPVLSSSVYLYIYSYLEFKKNI